LGAAGTIGAVAVGQITIHRLVTIHRRISIERRIAIDGRIAVDRSVAIDRLVPIGLIAIRRIAIGMVAIHKILGNAEIILAEITAATVVIFTAFIHERIAIGDVALLYAIAAQTEIPRLAFFRNRAGNAVIRRLTAKTAVANLAERTIAVRQTGHRRRIVSARTGGKQ